MEKFGSLSSPLGGAIVVLQFVLWYSCTYKGQNYKYIIVQQPMVDSSYQEKLALLYSILCILEGLSEVHPIQKHYRPHILPFV